MAKINIGELHYTERIDTLKWAMPYICSLPLEEQCRILRSNIASTTCFFREMETFSAFMEVGIPENSRIASVGCSTGEEAYSLAILTSMQIDGYDSNPANIEHALRGEYIFFFDPPQELEGMAEIYGSAKRVKIRQDVKKRTNFQLHDIMDGKLPRNYEAVFLMNMLYHYPEKGRKRIIENVRRSLNCGGLLACEESLILNGEYSAWMRSLEGFERVQLDDELINIYRAT